MVSAEESEAEGNTPPRERKTYAEIFDECFPRYLAWGMTAEQYWEQDSSLVIDYRKAHKLRMEDQNFFSWLTGRYVLEAINTAFSKKGSGISYPAKPRPLYDEPKKEKTQTDEDREAYENAERIKAKMMAMMAKNKEKAKPESPFGEGFMANRISPPENT